MKIAYSTSPADFDAYIRTLEEPHFLPYQYLVGGLAVIVALPWLFVMHSGLWLFGGALLLYSLIICVVSTGGFTWFFLLKRPVIERYWVRMGHVRIKDPTEMEDDVILEILPAHLHVRLRSVDAMIEYSYIRKIDVRLTHAYIQTALFRLIIPYAKVREGDYQSFIDTLRARTESPHQASAPAPQTVPPPAAPEARQP
jgi:hypothetical protein